MADNLQTQSSTLATPAANTRFITLEGTFSGETGHAGLAILGTSSGAEGSRTFTDVTTANPLPISDAGSTLSVDDGAGSLTVDGTVAATQSGTWSSRTQDGSGNALTSATRGLQQALSVQIVDGSGNQVTSFGGSGGTFSTDDGAFTAGSGLGTPVMGFATADVVDSGDVGVLAMTTGRALHVQLQTGSNTIGALTANQSVNVAQLAGATPSATAYLPARITDGTNFITPSSDATHDSAVASTGPQIMAAAVAHGTNPTAVAAADAVRPVANRAGVIFTIGGHPNTVTLEANYTAAQTDAAIITVSAGTKIVVTQIAALCDNANTVDVGLRVGFAAAITPTTTGVVLTHPGIAPGSGFSRGDGSGILGIGADGEDLRITSEVPTTGALRILVSYFTIES